MKRESMQERRLGFAVKVIGQEGLRSHDTRRWQSGPSLEVSIEALHEIRKQARTEAPGEAPTPAFAVTAHTMPDQVETLLSEGFDGVLSKPIRTMDLSQALLRCRSESRPVDL